MSGTEWEWDEARQLWYKVISATPDGETRSYSLNPEDGGCC